MIDGTFIFKCERTISKEWLEKFNVEGIKFDAFNNSENGFFFNLTIDGQTRIINCFVGNNESFLTLYDSELEKLIEFVKQLYSIIKCPVIGFNDDSHYYNSDISIWRDYFKTQKPDAIIFDALFDFNIFTPKQVEKIGIEKLLASSAYHKDVLDDGGIVLQLDLTLAFGTNPETRNKIRKELGMKIYEA